MTQHEDDWFYRDAYKPTLKQVSDYIMKKNNQDAYDLLKNGEIYLSDFYQSLKMNQAVNGTLIGKSMGLETTGYESGNEWLSNRNRRIAINRHIMIGVALLIVGGIVLWLAV